MCRRRTRSETEAPTDPPTFPRRGRGATRPAAIPVGAQIIGLDWIGSGVTLNIGLADINCLYFMCKINELLQIPIQLFSSPEKQMAFQATVLFNSLREKSDSIMKLYVYFNTVMTWVLSSAGRALFVFLLQFCCCLIHSTDQQPGCCGGPLHEAGATTATHEEDAVKCQSGQTHHAQRAGSSSRLFLSWGRHHEVSDC